MSPSQYLWIPAETGWFCGLTGFIRGDHKPWVDRVHQNPLFQIVMATHTLRFTRGKQRFSLERGGFLLLRPNEQHRSWGPIDPNSGFYFARFRTDATPIWRSTPPLLSRSGPSVHITHVVLPDVAQLPYPEPILTLFDKLVTSRESVYAVRQVLANGLIAQLIAMIAQQCAAAQSQAGEGSSDQTGIQISKRQVAIIHDVIDYIERHLNQPIRPANICRELNLSYKYVARLMSSGLGMTLTEYLNRRRIHKARALLLQGDCSIAEVAHAVGFTDPFYFSRVFRELEGVPPSLFRKGGYGPQ